MIHEESSSTAAEIPDHEKLYAEDSRENDESDSDASSGMDDDLLPDEHLLDYVALANHDGEQGASFPKTYLVIQLSPTIQPAAVTWLVEKITGKKQDGGAELLVRCQPISGKSRESLVLHVTASKLKFLECAEYLELKKLDSRGILREFNVADLDDFLHGTTNLENLLTAAEKQLIVNHELDNIRVISSDTIVPGYPEILLHTGQSVFNIYLQHELIQGVFPLHDKVELEKLGKQWYYALFRAQPFDEIRQYFGDAIALYFSFLGFYTVSLIAPALLGILQFFLSDATAGNSLLFFCVFNLIWVTITQELWKRKCSELAYSWGTLRMTTWEEPRANYRGVMAVDPVTGRFQPVSPWWHTTLKVYCVSLPVVAMCLICTTWIMLYSIWLEEYLTEAKQRHGYKVAGWLTMLPSIGYAVLVWFINNAYRKLATFLTEWENHRTQSQFERHRVTKLVFFEFVNTFMSLFYLAFYIQDFEMLKNQVTVMLIAIQFFNHFQEALLPLVIRRGYVLIKNYIQENFPNGIKRLGNYYEKITKIATEMIPAMKRKESTAVDYFVSSPTALGLQCLEANDPRIKVAFQQKDMDTYEGLDDYLEIFIQFGYVFLFSAVSPLAAVYAIINNVIEIRADAFKLCKVSQRPLAKRVKDIGAWQTAFECIGVIAVTTNCALLCLSPNLRSYAPNMTSAEWLLLFVLVEHCVIALKLALAQLIPDMPAWVKVSLACLEYRSRQALKNEQTFKARRQLTRRFKTIHIAGKKNPGSTSVQRRKNPKRQNGDSTNQGASS